MTHDERLQATADELDSYYALVNQLERQGDRIKTPQRLLKVTAILLKHFPDPAQNVGGTMECAPHEGESFATAGGPLTKIDELRSNVKGGPDDTR